MEELFQQQKRDDLPRNDWRQPEDSEMYSNVSNEYIV